MHAASSTAATAVSRAARAEDTKNETTASADDTPEAWRHVAKDGAGVAVATEQAQREAADVSASAAVELTGKTADSEQVSRRQQERRAKMLVRLGDNDGHRK